jgi:hypothetical protein
MTRATKRHTLKAPIEGVLVASEEGDSAAASGIVSTPSEASDIASFVGEVRWTIYAALQAPVPGCTNLPTAVSYVARMKRIPSAEALDLITTAGIHDQIHAIEQHRFADGWEQTNIAATLWPAIAKRLRIAEDGRMVEWAEGMGWGDDWMLYVPDEDLDAQVASSADPAEALSETPSKLTALPPGNVVDDQANEDRLPGEDRADADTKRFLRGLMTKHRTPPPGKKKDDWYNECRTQFGVARRAFNRHWDWAIDMTGATAYRDPGPRGPRPPK